ncbi:acyl-ACP--UDP-N-acetylglucosamine O-acyltransferase [Spiribacter sp. C176]|uniref:Acyl-ACP--UDP-N-acetylglucosamine O-acyltransferase n=2 Tax=Spiribacter salilacus TaxID=2664894 RepID=A0A6N7QNG6_9GAMM|nr:acyl-ACP--UDP-N-acetylglucosamine O-acyltransferase [Spiribacter salilacus]
MGAEHIHPTAIIDPQAVLGANCHVGPYAVIGAGVVLGNNCTVGAHAVLEGPLEMGPNNRIGPHALLGQPPQDLTYAGEPTQLVVGEGNDFREFTTAHRASTKEDGITRVGNHGLFMAFSHIAHDDQIGDHVIIGNGTQLAGHVHIHNQVFISGLCAIHQFVHIGRLAMVAGGSMVDRDVAPFTMVAGDRAQLRGLNSRGLQRAGIPTEHRRALRQAYQRLFRDGGTLNAAVDAVATDPNLQTTEINVLLDFIRHRGRGITR